MSCKFLNLSKALVTLTSLWNEFSVHNLVALAMKLPSTSQIKIFCLTVASCLNCWLLHLFGQSWENNRLNRNMIFPQMFDSRGYSRHIQTHIHIVAIAWVMAAQKLRTAALNFRSLLSLYQNIITAFRNALLRSWTRQETKSIYQQFFFYKTAYSK